MNVKEWTETKRNEKERTGMEGTNRNGQERQRNVKEWTGMERNVNEREGMDRNGKERK